MNYNKQQSLNSWVKMLDGVYGRTQNYNKSAYEIFAHLVEVSGAFAKYLFKKHEIEQATAFLPKMFSWAVAVFAKVKGPNSDLEEILLVKFPTVCPYCLRRPCACEPGKKGAVDEDKNRDYYFKAAAGQGRSVNDFQLMFRLIYEGTWTSDASPEEAAFADLRHIYTRLVEELSELNEAIRFYHLYPSHFDNELADFFAWWFALCSIIHRAKKESDSETLLCEDLLWEMFPGRCPVCRMQACDCRPGPVRELLSKPSLGEAATTDYLTSASNDRQLVIDLGSIKSGQYILVGTTALAYVDVDSLRLINEIVNKSAGNQLLKHLVNVARQKIRSRDRLYRVEGDEFLILFEDYSLAEACGVLSRIQETLRETPMNHAVEDGTYTPNAFTISVGISQCRAREEIEAAMASARERCRAAFQAGGDRILSEG